MEEEIKIVNIDPTTFETQEYQPSDENLIVKNVLDTEFNPSTDYIEYFVYDGNKNLINILDPSPLTSYRVKDSDVILQPSLDLQNLGFDIGLYYISYSFYKKLILSSPTERYFISEISSDRTEIRLDSNVIDSSLIENSVQDFILYRENSNYFVDFKLNLGNNNLAIANNIKLDLKSLKGEIIIKLYEALPPEINIKDELWVVEEISTIQSYQVTFPEITYEFKDYEFMSGPNFNIEVRNEKGESGQELSYDDLLNTNFTSSQNQIISLLDEKGININVNYEDFNEFIHFSSAKTRLENFYYKVKLIEDYNNELVGFLDVITSSTTSSADYISSKTSITSEIDFIIKNFDEYEYFLYYNSGSLYSWPKNNLNPPYILATTGSVEALTWLGTSDPTNPYYGGQILAGQEFDEDNKDWLYNSVPEYLKTDANNDQYMLFLDMVGQHFDNIWIYIKDIQNKFSSDNRLDYGISKDLVADAIRDFGVKLYSNNYNKNDLYTAFLGTTNLGSLFPYPEMETSLPVNSGYEYIDTPISSSNDIVPLDDINKRIYKRIYHNLPYLLKTKGTVAGLRALITSYGIPDTILRINEFGGKDKDDTNDWDLIQNRFNYEYDTKGVGFISSSLDINPNFGELGTIQFRFKTKGVPNSPNTQNLLELYSPGGNPPYGFLSLEYSGTSLNSGSYLGSSFDEDNTYGDLVFLSNNYYPPTPAITLPFFNGDWWSVQLEAPINGISYIRVGTKSSKGQIHHYSSSFTNIFPTDWDSYSKLFLSSQTSPFSGSFQELRYFTKWNPPTQNVFYDYVMNPYSTEGNNINSSPEDLIFRADLGTLLDPNNRISTHPKISGATSYISSSFIGGNSSFYINGGEFIPNKELIYIDQSPIGIKNRITDKIQLQDIHLPNPPSGSDSSLSILSPMKALQQNPAASGSYSPHVNYVEIALSPQDEINDDISSQLGYFNIGDYIGDPRHISSSAYSYPDLNTLRDAYFSKYIKSYDIKDFVRLIKFFDNSLFKMLKDFVPARTSLTAGVVIKQHLLERNRQRPAQVSSTMVNPSGSIQTKHEKSLIYGVSGGTGGGFERYNGLNTSPSQSILGLSNNFNLTQSWEEVLQGPLGPRTVERSDQLEFYNGEFKGSNILVTNGNLAIDNSPYLSTNIPDIYFKPIFFSTATGPTTQGTVTNSAFLEKQNSPKNGYVWIISDFDLVSNKHEVSYIKLPNQDLNGNYIKEHAADLKLLEMLLPEGIDDSSIKYYVDGYEINNNNITLTISQTKGDYTQHHSINGGSEDWSLISRGDYSQLGVNDDRSQGNFNKVSTYSNQIIKYWNGENSSSLEFFNSGSPSIGEEAYNYGSYNIKRTPNIPWHVSCSIAYSASIIDVSGGASITGLYHSASYYSARGYNMSAQNYTLTPTTPSGIFKPSPEIINLEPTVFNILYDKYKLGDYGVGFPNAGHPQIINAGTSSLDFYFPNIKLGGTPPNLSINSTFTALSGSSLVPSNNDFDGTFNEPWAYSSIINLSAYSSSRDGSITFSNFGLSTYLSLINFELYQPANISFQNITAKVSYTILAEPGLNFTSSLWTSPTFPYTNQPPNSINNQTTETSPGVWQAVNKTISLENLGIGVFDINYLRIGIKSLEESSFVYILKDCYITLEVDYTNNGTPWFFDHIFTLSPYNQSTTSLNVYSPDSTTKTNSKTDIVVNLYYSGSDGNRLITSSAELSQVDIFPGKTFTFPDSPILSIYNPNNSPQSTINSPMSLYYIEYSMSNYTPGSYYNNDPLPVSFLGNGDTETKIFITQSFNVSDFNYRFTGSLNLYRGNNNNPNNIGSIISTSPFIIPTDSTVGRFNTSFSINNGFIYDDVYRLGIQASKNYGSGLVITEYTMSIFPSSSIFSPLTLPSAYNNYIEPISTLSLIPTYFGNNVLPFYLALDSQPLLNNVFNQRLSNYFMGVDYNNSSEGLGHPINQERLLSLTSEKTSTPDSNYTMARVINSRYKGSKITGNKINVWNPKDVNTYGKSPVIELRTAYFGYFNIIKDPYPNINNNINLNLLYLIDEQGNALPPSLQGIGYYNLIHSFPEGEVASLSIDSGSKELKGLNELYVANKVGKYVSPIMYSQTSSRGWATEIPLTGSRYISRYDNNDSDSFSIFSFTSQGTSSIAAEGTLNLDEILNPTETLITPTSPNVTSSYSNGVISFPRDYHYKSPKNEVTASYGFPLSDNQFLSVETTVDTSYLYESGVIELELKLILEKATTLDGITWTDYTPIPPTLEDISLIVVKTDTSKINMGSVISSNNDIVRFVTGDKKGKKFFGLGKNYKKGTLNKKDSRIGSQSPILNSKDEVEMVIENYALNSLLLQKGLYTNKLGGSQEGGLIKNLQWVIKANSGLNQFNQGDKLRWRIKGLMTPGKKFTNSIIPTGTDFVLPTKIKLVGSLDHLVQEDNKAQSPYWVYSGSAGNLNEIVDSSILVMSSSNMNDAYGTDFFQGEIPYVPGTSEYFPGGFEPSGSQFDSIVYPLSLQAGDEIRFINNENYTYRIKEVISPKDNIEGDGEARLKIVLDGNVPTSINKNFFLVRRYVDNANSILLDTPFPYSNPPLESSTPGIIFPEYPVISLQASASKIITDLVGKGVIK
jgi:hypothetical protein